MKYLYIILMLLFFPSFAFANACRGLDFAPKLVFTSSYGDLNYDLSKNKEYISSLAIKHGQEENFVAGGLAMATLEMSVNFKAEVKYKKETDVCITPTEVSVFIGFQDPTIYIANHLKEGECRFYVTLRHEQAHMQINKKTLEYYLPDFKKGLQRMIENIKPLNIGNINDVNQANEYINQQYYSEIKKLVTRFNEILAQEHRRLDNKENYAYEATLCK